MTITQERINKIWKGARHLFNGSPFTQTQRLEAALDLSDLATQRGISGLDDYAQIQFRTYGIGRVIDSLAPYVSAEDPMKRMEHAAEATRVASDVFRTVSEKRNLDTTIDFALQLYELGMHYNFESLTIDVPDAATKFIAERDGQENHYDRLFGGMRAINQKVYEQRQKTKQKRDVA